jgi:hypothetical protein
LLSGCCDQRGGGGKAYGLVCDEGVGQVGVFGNASEL